jgi:hypothetical protein
MPSLQAEAKLPVGGTPYYSVVNACKAGGSKASCGRDPLLLRRAGTGPLITPSRGDGTPLLAVQNKAVFAIDTRDKDGSAFVR